MRQEKSQFNWGVNMERHEIEFITWGQRRVESVKYLGGEINPGNRTFSKIKK